MEAIRYSNIQTREITDYFKLEVERLRRENEKLLGVLESANRTAERRGQERDEALAWAGRLAEDLGAFEEVAYRLRGGGYHTSDDAAVDIEAIIATSRGCVGEAALRWLEAVEKRAAAEELERMADVVYCTARLDISTRAAILRAQADELEKQ